MTYIFCSASVAAGIAGCLVSFAPAVAEVPGATPPEIVVTATRRVEPLSRVAASVSALTASGMDMRGIRSIADVARFTPGLRFDPASGAVSIRGIASNGAGAGTTGIYIDDTPIQMRGLGFNPDEALPAIFDLERVEVLRGPQGTLFGAGSEGGTIRYITPQPPLNDPSSYARAEVSTVAHGGASWEAGSALGTPLVQDRLGLRISAWHRREAGFIDHVDNATDSVDDRNINHGDVTTIRGALAWQPAHSLLVTPAILYQRRSTNAWNTFFAGISDRSSGVFRTSSPEYRGGYDRYVLPTLNTRYTSDFMTVIANLSYYRRHNLTGYDGTIYDLSYYQHADIFTGPHDGNPNYPFLLSSGINPNLPAYYSPSQVLNGQSIWTGELRVQSPAGARLEWTAGVFQQRSRSDSAESLTENGNESFYDQVFGASEPDIFGFPNYGSYNYLKKTRAVEQQTALFGDLRLPLSNKLRLGLGGRYAWTSFSFDSFEAGNFTAEPLVSSGRTAQHPFTPRFALEYQATRNTLLYVNWAKGFRPGGANPAINPAVCQADLQLLGLEQAPDSYGTDTVRTVEAGIKTNLANGGVRLAASAYRNVWSGIQQNVYLANCGLQFVANLGQARVSGFDLQATVSPVRHLTVDVALGYTHGRFSEAVALGPGVTAVQGGDAIEGAPWTIALGARYDIRLGERTYYVRGDGQHLSRLRRATPERNPTNVSSYLPGEIPPDAVTNLSLRAGALLGAADVSIFVDNLLDGASRYSRAPVDAEAQLATQMVVRPRVVGLTLVVRQ